MVHQTAKESKALVGYTISEVVMNFLLLFACRTTVNTQTDIQSNVEDTAVEELAPTEEVQINIDVPPHYWITDTLTFSSTDRVGEILQYEWSCNNGITGTEPTLEFTSDQPGKIECSLRVSGLDNEYTTTANTMVHAAAENAEWTILVYLGGDNNLEEAAIIDLNEMEKVGSDENINIIVELDRSRSHYQGHDNWYGAKRYYVVKDTTTHPESDFDEVVSIERMSLGEVDSGDPETMTDFLHWGITEFPAKKVAVIFWNHGWSWSLQSSTPTIKGIISDDGSGNDISIAEGELSSILSQISEDLDRPIDLLGMDACVMQSWEIATDAAPFADLLVASQDYVSWAGWSYDTFLKDLATNPSMEGLTLANHIGERFYESGDLTISTVDLTQIGEFNQQLDELATQLMEQPAGILTEVSRSTYSPDGGEYGNDHDLFGLLNGLQSKSLSTETLEQIDILLDQQSTLLPHNHVDSSMSNANGLSIFAPPAQNWELDNAYFSASWAEHQWDELLAREQESNLQ